MMSRMDHLFARLHLIICMMASVLKVHLAFRTICHDVKPEDITNATMLDLAELLGTENMLTLVESYSGMIIYVPKLDSLLRNIRDRRIRQGK